MAVRSLLLAIFGPISIRHIISNLPYLAGLGLLTWFVYCGCTWIYNIFFHPLRKFPGPIFSRASPLPAAFYFCTGNRLAYIERAHAKYGAIVRIEPDSLSFIDEQAWKDIHMHRQDTNGKGMKQLAKYPILEPANGIYSIMNAPDDAHSRMRKALSHAFSDRALKEQEPLLRSYTDLVMRNMRDDAKCERVVDIVEIFSFLTFDIIGELAFGESFNATETRKEHPWFALFWTTLTWGAILQVGMTIPFAFLILLPKASSVREHAKKMFGFAKGQVKKRIAQGDKDRPDFMARVLKHNTNDENGFTIPEIESTFELLAIAGSETTATAMSGLMWLCHTNPYVLHKLQQELRTSFSSDSSITLLKVDRLPYLHAVIQESLRMYPPTPIALTRRTPPSGISICGEWIPGNTTVGVPHQIISYSPLNFKEPMSFVPERHLPSGQRPEMFEGDKRGAMQPFGTGPRGCLGKNLAYAEMKLTISRLLYNFDFELVKGQENWFKQKSWGLYDKGPLRFRVKEWDGKE